MVKRLIRVRDHVDLVLINRTDCNNRVKINRAVVYLNEFPNLEKRWTS